MVAAVSPVTRSRSILPRALWNPTLAIAGPRIDAFVFWGGPVLAAALIWCWADMAAALPEQAGQAAVSIMVGAIAVLTFAHLIAAAPRAYLNPQVFAANRARLTVVPVLLIAALFLSPTLLIVGSVLAVFWDVHHSAMQTFGLARIYDMKAGNDPQQLRGVDLALNWVLYVGPLAAGASLHAHMIEFGRLEATPLSWAATAPGVVESFSGPIKTFALIAWSLGLIAALLAYAYERRRGYRMPVHKAALLISTGRVSMLAWGWSPPFIAFALINLFHAVQYFVLVWLKEGQGIGRALGCPGGGRKAMILFLGLCGVFGFAYFAAARFDTLLAPFVACSLLHFWYDSFIWSVRKQQVQG